MQSRVGHLGGPPTFFGGKLLTLFSPYRRPLSGLYLHESPSLYQRGGRWHGMSDLRPPYSTTASSRRKKKRRGNDEPPPSLEPAPPAALLPSPLPQAPVAAPAESVDASSVAAAPPVVRTPAAAARPATTAAARAGSTRISFAATPADGSTPVPGSVRVPVSGSPGLSTASSISTLTQRAGLSLGDIDEEAAAADNTENEGGELPTRDIVRMALVDQMQEGDGGDSDNEDDAAIDLDGASKRDAHASDEFDQGTARGVDLEDMMMPHNAILGAPDGWTPPGPPDGWSPKEPKDTCPHFNEVDNPGEWSPFAMQAKYQKGTGKYLGHYMPGGAKVVPKDSDTATSEAEVVC